MAKSIVMVVSVILVLVGLLGFVNNPVIGLFPVNALHNVVHLVSGILGIVFAMKGEGSAKGFAKIFGIVYLLVAILGFIAPTFMEDLLMVEMYDNILHLVLGVVFLWAGFAKGGATSTATV